MAEKIMRVVEEIEKLTVLELNELIKLLEEKFGIQGMMPVAAPAAAAATEATAVPSKVNIVLTDAGANKIQVIKALREINPQLGLKEAKEMTDNVPTTIKEEAPAEEAQKVKEKIEAAGGKVELK